MREGVIVFSGIHDFGEGFVGHELGGGEGDGHAEGGRVGDVESGETLDAVEGTSAVGDGSVGRAVDLHSLFDDWNH